MNQSFQGDRLNLFLTQYCIIHSFNTGLRYIYLNRKTAVTELPESLKHHFLFGQPVYPYFLTEAARCCRISQAYRSCWGDVNPSHYPKP